MNILVTGAKGFVGKNLIANLKNIRDKKDTAHRISVSTVFEHDVDTPEALFEEYCRQADFVFNLAGANRPKDAGEFMQSNYSFAENLLRTLQKYHNTCPVMLASSIQASLTGRYADSEYGKSKRAGEQLFFDYGKETSASILVYRFPNLFGKWCRPNYNSVVATFCNNIARDIPIHIDDPASTLELLYIDDLIEELLSAITGNVHRCEYDGIHPVPCEQGSYCFVPSTHTVTVGKIAELLTLFREQEKTLYIPAIPANSFEKKLYSTYLSYLPASRVAFPLEMHIDERGSFTELLKTLSNGQFSVNISKPGVTKGEHWHNSKWEFFFVVSGHARIQERNIVTGEILEFDVSGEKIEAVHMLPGYAHNIKNLSESENLVTVMWANEPFDKNHPDTFSESAVNRSSVYHE